MAKDAKGHGSNKRGANTLDVVYSSKAGVGGHGKGMYARTASGAQYKLNPAVTAGRIPRVGSDIDPSQHTTVIAAMHNVPTAHLGAFKVQALALDRTGSKPWATTKSYGNRAVAERVAQHMRQDGGYMRVKTK